MSKIKKILTSKITIGVVCFVLGGVIFGSNSGQQNDSQISEEVSSKADSSNNSNGNNSSKKDNGLKQMKLGEVNEITTSSGNYKFTIEGIRFTDERNQFSEKPSEKVFFFDFNYENVSSTDEVFLFDSNFKIMDDQGNVLDTYPVSDDARSSKSLPIGAKCNASATYALASSSKTIRVLFYDNMYGKPIGELTIETGL